MFAEDFSQNGSSNQPKMTINASRTTIKILNSFVKTTPKFIIHIKSSFFIKKVLNEEELTQEFVALLRRELLNLNYPFCVGQVYKDIYYSSRGRSDFYIYPSEEEKSTKSIFSVEAKRLPAPKPVSREKEYVIWADNNGGIERYKIGKHGQGLSECGMLGFVEQEDFKYWGNIINTWITNLTTVDPNWKGSEILHEVETVSQYCRLGSTVHRIKEPDLSLYHLWILL